MPLRSKANPLLRVSQKQRPEAAQSDDNSDDGQSGSPTSSRDSLQGTLQRKADVKRALLRRPEYDPPARVADGLFIGVLLRSTPAALTHLRRPAPDDKTLLPHLCLQ